MSQSWIEKDGQRYPVERWRLRLTIFPDGKMWYGTVFGDDLPVGQVFVHLVEIGPLETNPCVYEGAAQTGIVYGVSDIEGPGVDIHAGSRLVITPVEEV